MNFYRLAHGGPKGARRHTGPPTRTAIIQGLTKVKKNAAGVVKSGGQRNWLVRLAKALALPLNQLAHLHHAVNREGVNIWALQAKIDWALRTKVDYADFSAHDFSAIKVLAALDVETVVPKRGHPDPPLERLVNELAPVWCSVTGTSAYPKNSLFGGKICPFAEWIHDLVKDVGLWPPSSNTVALLVRRQKTQK